MSDSRGSAGTAEEFGPDPEFDWASGCLVRISSTRSSVEACQRSLLHPLRQCSSRSRTEGANPSSVTILGFAHDPCSPSSRTYHRHVRQHRVCTAPTLAIGFRPINNSPTRFDVQDTSTHERRAPSRRVTRSPSQHLDPILRYRAVDRQPNVIPSHSLLCSSSNRPNRVSHHDLFTVRTVKFSGNVRLYVVLPDPAALSA